MPCRLSGVRSRRSRAMSVGKKLRTSDAASAHPCGCHDTWPSGPSLRGEEWTSGTARCEFQRLGREVVLREMGVFMAVGSSDTALTSVALYVKQLDHMRSRSSLNYLLDLYCLCFTFLSVVWRSIDVEITAV